jgi:hypothetical protein
LVRTPAGASDGLRNRAPTDQALLNLQSLDALDFELFDCRKRRSQGVGPGCGQLPEVLVILFDALLPAHVQAVTLVNQQVDRQPDGQIKIRLFQQWNNLI